jgi:hypothetical protein
MELPDIQEIRDSKYFIWIEVIGALLTIGQQIWIILVFSGNKFLSMKLFADSENKVRDAVIVVLNVIIGYIIPLLAFFVNWSIRVPSWAEITIYIFAGFILINNLILWVIIGNVFKMTRSINEDKLYKRK